MINKDMLENKDSPTSGKFLYPLLVIATAQLTIVMDDFISNIALPNMQQDLGISASNLPWVINAYILAFGALLLFGGKLGDIFGRKRILQIGVGSFTIASMSAGLAQNDIFLIASRFIQGTGAAMIAPNVLALIAVTFPQGKQRNTALAVYGAMSGLGMIIGLLLGGVLTSVFGWRWVYFITVPIGILILTGSRKLADAERQKGELDIVGAVTGTFGMASLVYAITRAGEYSWTDSFTMLFFLSALVLLTIFIVSQTLGKEPMLPLSLFKDRNRSGSYLGMVFLAFAPMGVVYLMTLYMQIVLGFSPLQTGLAWLPFSAGVILATIVITKLVAKFRPRSIVALGMFLCSASMFWLSTVSEHTDYVTHLLPAIFIVAFGFGMSFIPLTLAAVNKVEAHQSGIASALLNASQQIGTALGLAVLSSIAVTVTANQLPDALTVLQKAYDFQDNGLISRANNALISGYSTALKVGAFTLVTIAIISFFVINAKVKHTDENQ